MDTCLHPETLEGSYRRYLSALLGAGLLIESGVPGVYGLMLLLRKDSASCSASSTAFNEATDRRGQSLIAPSAIP